MSPVGHAEYVGRSFWVWFDSGVVDANAEGVPTPSEFTALTRKVYVVPFVKPVTAIDAVVLA